MSGTGERNWAPGIPGDVLKAAKDSVMTPKIEGELFGVNYILPVAKAIMAERERCGKSAPHEDEAAYGLLWRMHSTDQSIHAARRALRDKIGKDGQRRGITWARVTFGEQSEPTLENMP